MASNILDNSIHITISIRICGLGENIYESQMNQLTAIRFEQEQ